MFQCQNVQNVCIYKVFYCHNIYFRKWQLRVCVWLQVIILIGNKADLEAQRDVTYEEAKQFAEENGESMKVLGVGRRA